MNTKKLDLPDGTGLVAQMAAGRRTAVSVVSEHIERLEANHERLNAAVRLLKDEALAEARSPRPGPLSGLPISVKETIGLRGESITAGSLRMPPIPCAQDAEIVRRLRAAGAIVVARSNVPEFAMAGETENLRYGRTNNPLDERRAAGGSSGGEGALVGSGCTVFGVGSDILGSIRIPAAFCGVVGFKPASGAVPKAGTWPQMDGLYLDSWLALGPITRSVRDARLVYNVLAERPLPEPKPVRGLRLIVPQGFTMTLQADCIKAALVHAQTVLEMEGLVGEERPLLDVAPYFENLQYLLGQELDEPFVAQLTTVEGRPFHLAAEVWRQAIRQPTIYSGLFQLLAAASLLKLRPQPAHDQIVAQYEALRRELYAVLGTDGVLLLPTLGLLAPPHGQMNRSSLKPGVNGTVTGLTLCNYANLPSITIPAWRSPDPETGLVPGVMLACAPGAEGMLLDVAAVLEAHIS